MEKTVTADISCHLNDRTAQKILKALGHGIPRPEMASESSVERRLCLVYLGCVDYSVLKQIYASFQRLLSSLTPPTFAFTAVSTHITGHGAFLSANATRVAGEGWRTFVDTLREERDDLTKAQLFDRGSQPHAILGKITTFHGFIASQTFRKRIHFQASQVALYVQCQGADHPVIYDRPFELPPR
jgi:hypothetical protein